MPTFTHAGGCTALDHGNSQHFLIPPQPLLARPYPQWRNSGKAFNQSYNLPCTAASMACPRFALPCGRHPGGSLARDREGESEQASVFAYCKLGLRRRQYTGHRGRV